jgi:hypothetical protein
MKQLFQKELEFWDLEIDIYQSLDKKLIEMLETEPRVLSTVNQNAQITWNRIGKINLNELNKSSQILFSEDI